jgi:acyl carrier protein
MQDKQKIFQEIQKILVSEFEMDANSISLESDLYQDLGLDSIDAVDLIIKIQELVGRKVDPTTFMKVRTVEEVVIAIEKLPPQL